MWTADEPAASGLYPSVNLNVYVIVNKYKELFGKKAKLSVTGQRIVPDSVRNRQYSGWNRSPECSQFLPKVIFSIQKYA